ncbi:hypothetical protein [Streptococcus mutans]|uniref:hypothetical protein n=1 Tax=Streptococcus mutans TaxID=1309 RepID=UPI00187C8F2C|nr:hypothetical protein [Streptococcus mutans]
MVIYGLSSGIFVDPLICRKRKLCLDLIPDNFSFIDIKGEYAKLQELLGKETIKG